MARLFQTGFELDTGPNNWTGVSATAWVQSPDGEWFGTVSRNTSNQRTGSSCLYIPQGAGTNYVELVTTPFGVEPDEVFIRFYFRKSTNPISSTTNWIVLVSGTGSATSAGQIAVALTNAGRVQLHGWDGSANTFRGTASDVLANDTWHLIELHFTRDEGANTVYGELKVNGTVVQSSISLASAATAGYWIKGLTINAANFGDHYYDDLAVNDVSGSVNNSWVGPGKVVLLKPISDAQRGSWVGGGLGTTDLWNAVDNTPPDGRSAAGGTNTTQIRSNDGSGNNATDEYRANLTTYSTAGITSDDTIRALTPWVVAGEEVTTGAKSISFGLYSNPSQTYTGVTDIGTVAVSTYPTGWTFRAAGTLENPSVTLGDSPVFALRKTDTGTRYAAVCGMYVYAEYALPTNYTQQCYGTSSASASVSRLSNFYRSLGSSAIGSASSTLLSSFYRSFGPSAAASAAITKSMAKTLSASGSASATYLKGVSKSLPATTSASPSLLRGVAKAFAAAATATADLAASVVAVTLQQCYAAASATASMLKSVYKVLGRSSVSAPSVVKGVSKYVTVVAYAVPSFSERLVLAVAQQCYATASASAALFRRVSISLATSAATSAAAAKTVGKQLSASATSVASRAYVISKRLEVASSAAVQIGRSLSLRMSVSAVASALQNEAMIVVRSFAASASAAAASTQTFSAGVPVEWFRKMRRYALTYIRRR